MYRYELKVRVRYSETDRMGYVYYGNYASYFEVGRVEMIRSLGFSYKKMEDEGVALPVLDFNIRYFKPAFYDDELRIEVEMRDLPRARIQFYYKTYNQEGELLNEAETTLVFINTETKRPCMAPASFVEALKSQFALNDV